MSVKTIIMQNFSKSFQLIFSRSLITSAIRTAVKSNKKKNQHTIVIVPPTHNDYNDVLKFMKKEYIPNEPTCKSLGITSCSILMDRILLNLSQGYSLIAKCKNTGNIMGVAINEKTSPWDADLVDKIAHSVQCPNLRKVLRFYAFLERAPNIFDKYKVHEVFEIANLGVAENSQNLGIATRLVKESKNIAASKGFSILRVDATSFYTARICEKLNMESILEIPYDSYLDADRQPVFKVPKPHTGVKVYIMKLGAKK
ncbi:uncharacterized protein LOC123315227 isoform X1 [Coccinella septempunctata]|uniref:uncharacterized protein LOC123315227 isoform X1 n=1 Tax=Coccinella septempunctata TaxID=41139 RepID=UPI001D069662|nr:uncharacterized protein LOC123315227 isoform X1 [Coccinella septempunctata]